MLESSSSQNPSQNSLDKFKKLDILGFCKECFTTNFQRQVSKFSFCVGGWVLLPFNSKYLRDFLKRLSFL